LDYPKYKMAVAPRNADHGRLVTFRLASHQPIRQPAGVSNYPNFEAALIGGLVLEIVKRADFLAATQRQFPGLAPSYSR
jgi:hypothetical protein